MALLMDWAAEAGEGRLAVGKMEVEAIPRPAMPTRCRWHSRLILFRDGVELARHEGAIARPQLQAFLDAHL